MRVHEINSDCCEEILEFVKKIGKYAKKVEEALEYGEFDSKKYPSEEDDDEEMKYKSKYKGMRYSRF